MTDPYVVVGLARTRCAWLSDLSRWSTSGAAPIEVLKCLTAEETRAVLGAGRALSALVVDGGTPGVDRELIATAASCDVPTVVVDDGRVRRDWDSLGCAAVLEPGFTSDDLMPVLVRHARPVDRSARAPVHVEIRPEPTRSRLVAVTGAGGTGSSTVAMALAQELARGSRRGTVALVDGARDADLAMYHDVGDVIPGLPELVESHRVDHPDPELIRDLLFRIDDRGYDLLLGMRRHTDWVAMRTHSLRAALDGLERSYDLVVVDHDPDLEGEDATGSIGVEDRHALARAAVDRADLVLVTAQPAMKSLHDLIRLLAALDVAGVPTDRIVPVITRAPRSPAKRSSIVRTLDRLAAGDRRSGCAPLFLPDARSIEAVHRSAGRLPDPLARPLGRAVQRLLLSLGSRSGADHDPVRIRPGELGTDLDDGWRSGSSRQDVA